MLMQWCVRLGMYARPSVTVGALISRGEVSQVLHIVDGLDPVRSCCSHRFCSAKRYLPV